MNNFRNINILPHPLKDRFCNKLLTYVQKKFLSQRVLIGLIQNLTMKFLSLN